jgi:hypothetical protein
MKALVWGAAIVIVLAVGAVIVLTSVRGTRPPSALLSSIRPRLRNQPQRRAKQLASMSHISPATMRGHSFSRLATTWPTPKARSTRLSDKTMATSEARPTASSTVRSTEAAFDPANPEVRSQGV